MKEKIFTLKSILLLALLTVAPGIAIADEVPIDSVVFIGMPDVMSIGEMCEFDLKVYPENATVDYFDIESSDEDVVSCIDVMYTPGFKLRLEAYSYGVCSIRVLNHTDKKLLASKTVKVVTTNPMKPAVANHVDLDFTAQNIDASQIDWEDSNAVTALLKTAVPAIKDGFTFKKYRSNTDIKGFSHYDCKQVNEALGNDVYGCELIAHVDKNGKLMYVTGNLADELSGEEFTDARRMYKQYEPTYDINDSPFTQKAELSGDLYYYKKDHITAEKSIAGATDGNGTYALQDPGRVYVLDYTNGDRLVGTGGNTMRSLLSQYQTFTSTSPTFSEGYNGMESKVKSLGAFLDPELNSEETVSLEIRKCKYQDAKQNGLDVAWNNGTTSLTQKTTLDGPYANFDLDDFKISMPNRQVDPDASIENDCYIARVSNSKQALLTEVIDIKHCSDNTGYIAVTRELTQSQPALDVLWGLERTLDVYKESFGLEGCDGHGSPIIALANYCLANNASSNGMMDDGATLMTFGFGQVASDDVCYPRTEIETIAHEYTHAVARKLMADDKETAAINESYADIMGKMVERKVLDNDYSYVTLGETVKYVGWKSDMVSGAGSPINYIRRFDDPSKDLSNDPNYYQGARWNELEREEHQDAGIQNYWFYLLCTGAENFQPEQGEKVTITAIPRDSAELIAFGALMYFANNCTNYPLARKNSIRAAELYFGHNSQEVKSVYNAWYAVGVGTDEWQPGMPTSLNAIYSDNTVANSDVRKVISNGRVIILKDGHRYSLSGQCLDF